MSGNKTKIGLGLAALGRPEYINVNNSVVDNKSEKAFKNNAFEVLDQAYKLGIRYFDTTPSYGKGEAFLYEWNVKHGYTDVVLGTKWGYTYMADWELGYAGKHEIKEHSLSKLTEQWEVSKVLLPQLKYYQIHSATLESGVLFNKDVLVKLSKLKREFGLKIGLTSSGINQSEVIKTALSLEIDGLELFDSFQVTYNIFEQSVFNILKDAIKKQKTVIIKEALANGRVFKNESYPHYSDLYELLKTLSKKYNVGLDAIALRYVMDSIEPSIVLSGASSKFQLIDNLKAYTFELSEAEIALLTKHKIAVNEYWEERAKLDWH